LIGFTRVVSCELLRLDLLSLALLCLSLPVELVGCDEDSGDGDNHKGVDDEHDTVIHEHLYEAFLLTFFLVLAVASRETLGAQALPIFANSTIQTLSEALWHLSGSALEISAPELVTLISQPDKLQNARIAVKIARQSNLFGLIGCDFTTAGETAVVASGAIGWLQLHEVFVAGIVANADDAATSW